MNHMGKRMKGFMRKRSWAALMLALLLIAAVGCESVGTTDLNKVMTSSLALKSGKSSLTAGIQITEDPDHPPSDEARKLIDVLNHTSLDISEIAMESKELSSMKGTLHLSRGDAAFEALITPERNVLKLADASKAIVQERVSAVNADNAAGISPEVLEKLQSELNNPEFARKLMTFIFRNLPNPPRVEATTASADVHGDRMQLNKVELTLDGTELLPLTTAFIKNVLKDDEGFKAWIGDLYDVLLPLLQEMKKNADETQMDNPYLAALFNLTDGDKDLAVNMIHTTLKQGLMVALVMLEGESKKAQDGNTTDGLAVLANKDTYLKLAYYIDENSNIRKSEFVLNLAPGTADNDGVKAIQVKTSSDAWDLNGPVRALTIDMGTDPLIVEPGMTGADVLNILDKQSPLYLFLKEDVHATRQNVYLFVDSEQTPGYDHPFLENGLTYIPVRYVSERLHDEVKWDGDAKTVTVRTPDGKHTIVMTVGAQDAVVDGKTVTLEGAPLLREGSVFVPARFLVESLGGTVQWDSESGMITITVE